MLYIVQYKREIHDNLLLLTFVGYTLSVGERNGISLYFTGAPRFNHMGQVVVFRRDEDKFPVVQRITVDQVGNCSFLKKSNI